MTGPAPRRGRTGVVAGRDLTWRRTDDEVAEFGRRDRAVAGRGTESGNPEPDAAGHQARAAGARARHRGPLPPARAAEPGGAEVPAHPPQRARRLRQDRAGLLVAAGTGLGVAGRLADPRRVRRRPRHLLELRARRS